MLVRSWPARALVATATLVIALAALPSRARAQASPWVSLDDPAYRELDVLVAKGMAGTLILGQRPHSRMAFARAVAEARARLGAAPGSAPRRIAEVVARLETRFAAELAVLGRGEAVGGGGAREGGGGTHRYVALREVSADATLADSPPRAIWWQLTSGIDADVNPLLQRNQGRLLADGGTLGGEARLDAVLGSRVAASAAPRLWTEHGVRAAEGSGSSHATRADATLLTASVRALVGNLSVEGGRNALGRGHARGGSTALSSNPRGLDLIRLSMERPGLLPWIFRGLGPVAFSAALADMGRAQDTPGSKLLLLQGSARPAQGLEVGMILLNHQGGGVDPDATFGERILDALFILPRRPFYVFEGTGVKSDKAAGLDARLTLPGPGVELFVEMLTTDDHDVLKAPKQALWHDAAWTAGGRMLGMGAQGRWDAWAEWTRVGLLPYTHHEFTSGLTLDRRVLGSPLGPLGTGIQAGVDRTGARGTLSLGAAWERYSGDTYRNPDDGESWRFRVADNPDEIRVRGTVAWEGHAARGFRTGARIGWERVTRFALDPASRSNVMAQVRLAYAW